MAANADAQVFLDSLRVAECGICMEPFSEGHIAMQSPVCVHIFGKECLQTWVTTAPSNKCPVCREPLFGGNGSSVGNYIPESDPQFGVVIHAVMAPFAARIYDDVEEPRPPVGGMAVWRDGNFGPDVNAPPEPIQTATLAAQTAQVQLGPDAVNLAPLADHGLSEQDVSEYAEQLLEALFMAPNRFWKHMFSAFINPHTLNLPLYIEDTETWSRVIDIHIISQMKNFMETNPDLNICQEYLRHLEIFIPNQYSRRLVEPALCIWRIMFRFAPIFKKKNNLITDDFNPRVLASAAQALGGNFTYSSIKDTVLRARNTLSQGEVDIIQLFTRMLIACDSSDAPWLSDPSSAYDRTCQSIAMHLKLSPQFATLKQNIQSLRANSDTVLFMWRFELDWQDECQQRDFGFYDDAEADFGSENDAGANSGSGNYAETI
ncbi:hypothetical protein BDV95DRAFT_604424 [Massariosphaeria phaeospora]|uniref:RING-type domain-containing protein n=1 Tax=Massariosphaeria phaeospora TaxID=100035 RepID=A0A7C8I9T0_9PLEO|nr:hypothetical protein BDV95DRAFT_604424 [Massariosphaeria phaeospora]